MLIIKQGEFECDWPLVSVGDFPSVGPIVKCRKRPILIRARQVAEPFVVETPEGDMTGAPCDWLMEGAMGELYVCANDVFKATYNIVE